jgi:hypothetical protein
MWRISAGAAMVVAGLYAFYYAHYHRPGLDPEANVVLSTHAYNWLHVAAWALVVFGGAAFVLPVIRSIRSWKAGS